MNERDEKISLAEKIRKLEQDNMELRKKLNAPVNIRTLEERIRFDKAIFRIPSFFTGMPDLDKAIYQSFDLLGKLSGADRIYLYRLHLKSRLVHVTHEYIIPGRRKTKQQ